MNFRKNSKRDSRYLLLGLCLFIGLLFYLTNKKGNGQVLPQPVPVLTSTSSATFAKVTRVVDGDTIVIDTGQKVRYIGMNTPEVESSECYASEASAINRDLVLGKEVRLEKDISDTDKYGRLLRYVYVGDIFVDDYLVKNGVAKVMNVPPDIKYKDEFLSSQNYAKVNALGLWAKCL